jgi:hypothetical protein
LGVGFANISTSFAPKIARFDALPPLFIAVSVATCDVSIRMFPESTPSMKVR